MRKIVLALAVCAAVPMTAAAQAASRAERPTAARPWSLSPLTASAVTVADIIGMTTFGSQPDNVTDRDAVIVSPDKSRVASVVKRGNLERGTMDFALIAVSL